MKESNEKELLAALQSSGPSAAYRFCHDLSVKEIVVAREGFRALARICKAALVIKYLENDSVLDQKVTS